MSRRLVFALIVVTTMSGAAAKVCALPAAGATYVADTMIGSQFGRFQYFGAWEHVRHKSDGRLLGSSSRTHVVGASVRLSFVGNTIRVYGVRGPGGGLGIVVLDGTRFPSIDFFAPTKIVRAVVFSSPLLPGGSHSISITALGPPSGSGRRSGYINLSGAAYE